MNTPAHSDSQLLANVFAMVGRCWIKEVDLELAKRLNDPATKLEFEKLGGYAPNQDENEMEALAIEYCQLLVGPKNHVLPVQSVWESDRLESESSTSMRSFFAILKGYEAPISMVDHLGVQLDFASHLLAIDTKISEDIFRNYYAAHLNWAEPLLEVVQTKTQSKFYLGLAAVTKSLLSAVKEEK